MTNICKIFIVIFLTGCSDKLADPVLVTCEPYDMAVCTSGPQGQRARDICSVVTRHEMLIQVQRWQIKTTDLTVCYEPK